MYPKQPGCCSLLNCLLNKRSGVGGFLDVFDGAQNQATMKEIQKYELMGGEECIKKILDQGRELTNYTPIFVECWSEIKSFSSLPRAFKSGKEGYCDK